MYDGACGAPVPARALTVHYGHIVLLLSASNARVMGT